MSQDRRSLVVWGELHFFSNLTREQQRVHGESRADHVHCDFLPAIEHHADPSSVESGL